ncbi:hypothetical protein IWW45_004920 [Coemansia sp. RSA 485]|nr:hypothetical protein IWW45_004920 [Coemansia sp. RSA 485]
MRKTTGLKAGLNLRKPGAPTQTTNADSKPPVLSTKSVFAENSDNDDTNDDPIPGLKVSGNRNPTYTKNIGSQISACKKASSTDQIDTDPSVYAYDEVYDEINSARNRIKNQRSKRDDLKPKYMEKLIETAKQRQIQNEVVRERLLTKERQREGEQFADKEVFVTDGYKKQKEMRQKLVEEEELREQQQQQQQQEMGRAGGNIRLGGAGFYRGILDHIDREDISKAIAENKDSLDLEKDNNEQHRMATEHEKEQPLLRAGLFVSSRNTQQTQQHQQHQQPGYGREYKNAGGRSSASDIRDDRGSVPAQHGLRRGGLSLSRGVAEQKRMQEQAREKERQELIRKYARRNDHAAIEAARKRYFQRQQEGITHCI